MANVQFDRTFAPAEAERGKFAPIDMSTLSPAYTGRGRYAVLTYQVNSTPISLSGDISVAESIPDTTLYESIEIPSATPIATINFSPDITLLEIYNNDNMEPIYLSFNNNNVSAAGLPVTAGSFYSIDRIIPTIYISNPSNTNVDVRIIGHYKA